MIIAGIFKQVSLPGTEVHRPHPFVFEIRKIKGEDDDKIDRFGG
jgi:hypothetical protein